MTNSKCPESCADADNREKKNANDRLVYFAVLQNKFLSIKMRHFSSGISVALL